MEADFRHAIVLDLFCGLRPPRRVVLKGGGSVRGGGVGGGGAVGGDPPAPSGDPELLEAPKIFLPKLTCAEGARKFF